MNDRSHCPYLGLRQNRAIRFASPTAEHRCYVNGEAQDIPVDQRTHCLSINHRACPLYTGEWSATTAGGVASAAAIALPRRGARGRLAGRELAFYLIATGLALSIIVVWLGIGYLVNQSATPPVADVPATETVTNTATATSTSTATATRTATATPDTPPGAPSGLTIASISTGGVTLDWENNSERDIAGYNVYRSGRPSDVGDKLNDTLIGTSSYDDPGVPLGVTSYYRVRAVDKRGAEGRPTMIRVQMPAVPPTATATITPTATLQPTLAPTQTPVPPRVIPGPPVFIPVTVTPPPPSPTAEPTAEPTALPTDPPAEPTSTSEPPTEQPTEIVLPTDAPPTPEMPTSPPVEAPTIAPSQSNPPPEITAPPLEQPSVTP